VALVAVLGHDIGAEWAGLRDVNAKLWDIEDRIRDKERDGLFDAEFVELARPSTSPTTSAPRSEQINAKLGSALVEEKSYAEYRKGVMIRG